MFEVINEIETVPSADAFKGGGFSEMSGDTAIEKARDLLNDPRLKQYSGPKRCTKQHHPSPKWINESHLDSLTFAEAKKKTNNRKQQPKKKNSYQPMNCCGCFLEWMRRSGKGSLSLKLCTVWWWHSQQCLSLCQHCRGGLLGGQTLIPVSACSRLHLRLGNWCMVKKKKKKNQTSDFQNSKSLTIRKFAVSTKILFFCCLFMFCDLWRVLKSYISNPPPSPHPSMLRLEFISVRSCHRSHALAAFYQQMSLYYHKQTNCPIAFGEALISLKYQWYFQSNKLTNWLSSRLGSQHRGVGHWATDYLQVFMSRMVLHGRSVQNFEEVKV